MSQSISRRSFLKCAGSGAVSLAAALLTGVSAAAAQSRLTGEPALLDGKAAVELLGYASAQEMGSVLVYLSVENAADASVFTLNLAAGRGALVHCFCAVPENWQTLELTWHPDFAAGRSVTFTVRRDTDEVALGPVPACPAEVGSVVDL